MDKAYIIYENLKNHSLAETSLFAIFISIKPTFMPAECYCCLSTLAKIPSPPINSTSPAGVCFKCHVLACLSHGHRDKTLPAFVCSICDPKLLIASAKPATFTVTIPPITRPPGQRTEITVDPPEKGTFSSLEDFKKRRPGYKALFPEIDQKIISYDLNSIDDFNDYFKGFPLEKQSLLVAAAVIAEHLYSQNSLEEMPEDIQFLVNNLKNKEEGQTWNGY